MDGAIRSGMTGWNADRDCQLLDCGEAGRLRRVFHRFIKPDAHRGRYPHQVAVWHLE